MWYKILYKIQFNYTDKNLRQQKDNLQRDIWNISP